MKLKFLKLRRKNLTKQIKDLRELELTIKRVAEVTSLTDKLMTINSQISKIGH